MNVQALPPQVFYPTHNDKAVSVLKEDTQKFSSFCYVGMAVERIDSLSGKIQKTIDERAAFQDSWLFYIFGKHRKVTVSMTVAESVMLDYTPYCVLSSGLLEPLTKTDIIILIR